MEVASKVPCPRCKSPSRMSHCKSPSCVWYSCYKCVNVHSLVVFDDKNRYFLWKE